MVRPHSAYYEPGRFLKRRTVRTTWVKRNDPDAVPMTAPLPPKLQERGILAPGLLAHILVSKYMDHLPLCRQEAIFDQRHGVYLEVVPENWTGVEAMKYPTRGDHRHVDETPRIYG